jgi:purine-nucleoside phosphorylase
MLEAIKETVSYIKTRIDTTPEVAVILGTGLGEVVNDIAIEKEIPYTEIPNFPVSTAPGHKGKLIFGRLGGKTVMAMQGRFHYYEGYSMEELSFPVRVMKFLGIRYLFISNASGGINPEFEIGDLMIIDDHINMMPNPLVGPHYEELGDRFPDMSEAYNHKLIELAESLAVENKIKTRKGCYVGVTGPTLETPREYQFFRIIGGDAVGMSTVPEVIVAHQMGIPCFAVSVITDLGVPGKIVEVSVEDVQKAAGEASPRMIHLMKEMIEKLD